MSEKWTWTCLDAGGAELPQSGATTFPRQADAEAYLSDSWAELAGEGVAAVSLHRDGSLVYGPMSLEAM